MKVASYCRVSTDKDDQVNSFAAQKRYFREYIERQPSWELYEIYADEGISGTSTKNRTRFNQMIADAGKGCFQVIITKEVSRFSRNILDTIAYTRKLKALGIAVIFLTDGICTLDPDAELRLSIMASLAQEESRRTSSRVVWGQTRQMEKGIVFGHSLLGYDVKDGKLTVNPEGAELVHLIFRKYAAEQISTSDIVKFLIREGYRTYSGRTNWQASTVIKILKNEKYVGDLIQKKTYTPDFLTHEKRRNRGAVSLIRIENHHEPIVSRELWNLAQERLRRNNKHAEGEGCHSNHYIFSGKIKCGECGSSFYARFQYRQNGTKILRWCCGTTVRKGAKVCDVGKLVRDDDAMQMLKTALRHLNHDRSAIIESVTCLALDAIQAQQDPNEDPRRLTATIERLRSKKEAMMDSYFSREITKEDMHVMKERYEQQLNGLQKRLDDAIKRMENTPDSAALRIQIQAAVTAVLNGDTESDVFYKTLLHSLTVFKDRHMELRLNRLQQIFHFTG